MNDFLLSFVDNQLLSSRNLSDISVRTRSSLVPLTVWSWQSPDSQVSPAIIFLFQTVKYGEILGCVARG